MHTSIENYPLVQLIINSTLQVISEIFPLPRSEILQCAEKILDLKEMGPERFYLTHLSIGAALLVYYRHEWAAMISSVLQIIFLQKKPMTMDERLPLYIVICVAPLSVIWGIWGIYQLPVKLPDPALIWGAALSAIFGVLCLFMDSYSKKNKPLFHINALDSILFALGLLTTAVPGIGFFGAIIVVASFRNYTRDAYLKWAHYCMGLMYFAYGLKNTLSSHDLNTTTFAPLTHLDKGVTVAISFLLALLLIGGLAKNIQKTGLKSSFWVRIVFGIAVVAYGFLKHKIQI